MNAQRFLMVHNGPDLLALAALLRQHGDEVAAVEGFGAGSNRDDEAEALQLLATLGPCDCMLLAPLAAVAPEGTSAVSDVLTRSFAVIKAALASWGSERDGRVVVLLPGEAAMGDPASPTGSAIAGAVLSLCRTVALESRKGRTTVNTVMYSPADAGSAEGVAMQVVALAHPASRSVNGQEIFATGAVDVGRLHP